MLTDIAVNGNNGVKEKRIMYFYDLNNSKSKFKFNNKGGQNYNFFLIEKLFSLICILPVL